MARGRRCYVCASGVNTEIERNDHESKRERERAGEHDTLMKWGRFEQWYAFEKYLACMLAFDESTDV